MEILVHLALAIALLLARAEPSTGSGYSCTWTFQGGLPPTSNECTAPPVTFPTYGVKRITRRVCRGGQCASSQASLSVLDPRPRIVRLSISPTEIYPGDSVTVSAVVSGQPPLAVLWQLSDGTKSASNPFSFTAPALARPLSVSLSLTNASGSARSSLYLSVRDPQPRLSSLSLSPSAPSAGDILSVSAHASGRLPLSYRWSISPDGVSFDTSSFTWSTAGAPPGPRTLTLSLSNASGTAKATRTFTLRPAPLVTSFAPICPQGLCVIPAGEAVSFSLLTSSPPSSFAYDWNGDGIYEETSKVPVISHAYTRSGSYRPRVRVSSGTRIETATCSQLLYISQGAG